jgi:hypothetical protein
MRIGGVGYCVGWNSWGYAWMTCGTNKGVPYVYQQIVKIN